ncbi:NTP transferase domain-containing protein [Haliscomenobacter hydrossis]|uniref:Probable molybdenum cofactor guanylyltransferase n=1 Tax=Haliscomenobacter hydrossis (strain ATCC 27775 / DSM 1100 / LMG 10767 / O) TaxID=760192 RepID=F4KUD2_HALH1|nr:NTP transferase domain-containing protein [Haliscomenobacter hydrossis]AEE51214.1 Molybdopterin-guanine dinucleotide biosynthesis protein A [Haliscomenobacter hydrossis DSM 1100]
MPSHQKHAAITRPAYGNFARQEWALIGAPCGVIKKLAFGLIERLQEHFNAGYVDADHASADAEVQTGRDTQSAMGHGAKQEYTDKISHHRFDLEDELNPYFFRQHFNLQDVVLVNGNHFEAKRQIVLIDPRKETSLQKKLDRLTNVACIVLTDAETDIYPFLQDHLGSALPPVFAIENEAEIADFLLEHLQREQAPLYGLVLAGGRSTRMGQDKSLINYHGKPQREFMADLLSHWCSKVFISCRGDQVEEIGGQYSPLPDTFLGLGPYGAILSAFREHPDAAWLVVACDLPHMDEATLEQLIAQRNPAKVASTFKSPFDQFPEPLVTIWEPRSYPLLLQFMAQGYTCPRKVLLNSPIELLVAENELALENVNKPEELEKALGKLKR